MACYSVVKEGQENSLGFLLPEGCDAPVVAKWWISKDVETGSDLNEMDHLL